MKKSKQLKAIVLLAILIIIGIFFIQNKNHYHHQINNEEKNTKLESFYKNKEDYENAFGKATGNSKEPITAGIISHHFLAKDLIASFFTRIDTKEIENVFIIGPDHYDSLSTKDCDLATSLLNWQTPYGIFYPNQRIINQMLQNLNIEKYDTAFKNEHSIYTLIPFAKKTFPEAMVIPLILKNSRDYNRFYNSGKLSFRKKSILIASIDFSHQSSKDIAKKNDLKSIKSLTEMDIKNLNNVESDCQQCLAFLYGFLRSSPSKFKLNDNKTSWDFGDQKYNNLTSYISGYFIASK